jgi:hypothetical protein
MLFRNDTIVDNKSIILSVLARKWDVNKEELSSFIEKENLGIILDTELSGRWAKETVYRVIDEKRWMYTRLRYGI